MEGGAGDKEGWTGIPLGHGAAGRVSWGLGQAHSKDLRPHCPGRPSVFIQQPFLCS